MSVRRFLEKPADAFAAYLPASIPNSSETAAIMSRMPPQKRMFSMELSASIFSSIVTI